MSLTNFQFDFSCYQCGHHPAVVVADANWKLAFDVPLETFKRPDPDTISDKDLQVDIVKAWTDLDRSLIAEGLISGTSVANPYSTTPGHSTLAPWMGENTRVGNILPKTEVKKALKRKPDDIKPPAKKINEDIILEIIESKKTQKKELQDACNALGVSSEGSIADMMNRLEELLNFKDIYPKLFLKLQKAGGGVLHFSCVHGVVYYLNFLFWTESARDHTDGLLSFKHFPTCFISDVAGQVARHTNNRTKQLFFQPHDGRLCAPTSDNLKLAAKKELKVDMQWVKNLRSPFPSQENPDNDRLQARHPITGTCERYSLYDRFHQKNQKRPEEKLRSLNICPTLRTEVNSSVAEQFNRELASVRYSLCQMNEPHFKQTVRVLIDLHNEKINRSFKAEMEALCNMKLSIGLHGMLGLQSAEGKVGNVNIQPDSIVKSSFLAQLYDVDDKDKEKLKKLLCGSRDENQALTHSTRRYPVSIKDMRSVCPLELLADSSLAMPWLTDDAVNYRIAQLAQENMCGSLGHFDFILWHREWTSTGAVEDKFVKHIPVSDKIFLPRIVGHSSPETGNHFILWVFDFSAKDIRVYDSLGLYSNISDKDMDLLRNVFRFSGGLQGWSVTYPPQWKQQDSVNCGVFVCSAAENEMQHVAVSTEALTLNQCRTLRLHHATRMIKNVNAEDFPLTAEDNLKMEEKEIKLQQSEAKKTDSSSHCQAWKTKSCLFQRATGTTNVFHNHIKKYQWVQCSYCKNWLHFECAGVKGDWTSKDFFCGCNNIPDINDILEAVKVEDFQTDEEILDLEKNLLSGHVLSNRMYLWKHRGFDPALKKHYSEHVTLFSDIKTDEIIQRLAKILTVPGTVAEKQLYITEVVLPEVLIQWLQGNSNMCRYQAESVLVTTTPSKEKKGAPSARKTADKTDSTEEENILIQGSLAAADWCRTATFDGVLKLPAVLSMDKEERKEALQELETWDGDLDEGSPAELFSFVFTQKKDYDKFCGELIDKKNYKLFVRFEEQ
uniref:Ubiquitin-like protease family profile domain-containing protein n=1 Tax=Dicentrarchus labrax TaxID=13489 RepID=A0A8P4FW34_DICLA